MGKKIAFRTFKPHSLVEFVKSYTKQKCKETIIPEASFLHASVPERSDLPFPLAAACYKIALATFENVSCIPTFSDHVSNRGFSLLLRSQDFSISRLILELYLVTYLPVSSMHLESLQKLFSWVFQVCNLEADKQMVIDAKEQKITSIILLSFLLPLWFLPT